MISAATAQSSSDDPEGRWGALGWLSLAMLLSMTTWFSASAILPQLSAQWHIAFWLSGFLTISVQAGFVVGSLLSSVLNLADVVRPRRLFLLGSLGAAGANFLIALSNSSGGPLVLRFMTGLFLALVYPPGLKAMSTWFKRGRGTALGVMVGSLTIGSALPHLLNAIVQLDWKLVIFVTSALTVLGGLIAEFATSDGPFQFPPAAFDPRQAPLAFANRGVRLACLGYFGHMWELYAMWTWFLLFFTAVLGTHGNLLPTQPAALATFAVIGVGGLGCLLGGLLGDKWGRTRTTALSMSISGACAVTIGLITWLPVGLVLLVGMIWGFWIVADSAQFSTIITEVADQRYVGTAVTLQLAVGFSLTVLSIFVIPVLRDDVSWRWAFAFLAPGPLLGVWAMLRLLHSPSAALIAEGRG